MIASVNNMTDKMKNKKCVTCGTDLAKNELPENKGEEMPLPFFPSPLPYECFVCYCKRADLDGPLNNQAPNHKKEPKLYKKFIDELIEDRNDRRKIN